MHKRQRAKAHIPNVTAATTRTIPVIISHLDSVHPKHAHSSDNKCHWNIATVSKFCRVKAEVMHERHSDPGKGSDKEERMRKKQIGEMALCVVERRAVLQSRRISGRDGLPARAINALTGTA